MKNQLQETNTRKGLCFLVLFMVFGIVLGMPPEAALAQSTPDAGTTIGNQASATYTDSEGNVRTVTSNVVETTVQQVASLAITQGITKTVSRGGQVLYPHTLTNTGNGTDFFALATAEGAGAYNFDSITIYADANGDGTPDDFNSPIIQTPNLAPGETFGFVIVANVPASALDGESETIAITATSNFDNVVTAGETNTALVSDNAVIDVVKSMNSNAGSPGDTLTVTLRFSNTGNTAGTNLLLNDPLPVGMTYLPGSGKWSGSGSTLTDINDGDEGGIAYQYDATGRTISATVASLASGQAGTLTFDVTVDGGTEGQTLQNTANYIYDGLLNPLNTNTVSLTVNESFGVALVGNAIVDQGPVGQGATVNFVNVFSNNGSSTDVYNISLNGSSYPSGTTFTLYKSDGLGNPANPLTDSDGDGIPDTGPVSPGANFEVILQVSLPAGASGDNGGSGFTVDKTATSSNDPNQSATHTDRLLAITANTVDLTNDSPVNGSAPGEGIQNTGEVAAVTANTTNPGTTTSFTLYINNTSGQSDNYNLAASTDNSFGTITLPADWSVTFLDPANGNTEVTGTGTIAAGANKQITAEVTIPADAAPSPAPGTSIFFRVQSPTSGAFDVKHDAIIINTIRNISLVSSQTGQIGPGGSKVYAHVLTNEGNVTENNGSNSALQLTLANSEASGFTSVVYWDVNEDGVIDAGDEIVTSDGNSAALPAGIGALLHGDQVFFLVKVTAAPGVPDAATNTTTLTVSDNTGNTVNGVALASASSDDITTVVAGNIVMEKKQALDDGTGNPGVFVTNGLDAKPGDVVYYQIVVKNQGSAAVTDVEVTDSTPAYTAQNGIVTVSGAGIPSIVTEPGNGNSGALKVSAASLAPGESFTITFAVTIDS